MNRVRILIVLILALLVGGGLAFATHRFLQSAGPQTTAAIATRPVVVAGADLSLGSALRAEDLKVVQWPASAVPDGAFADPAEIAGRGLIAPVVRQEPILAAKLASKEAGSGLPPIIPTGKRAVSVKVNDVISVAGYVLPGTFVDVLATANATDRPEEITAKVALSNVQVLTSGTRLEQDTKDGKPMQVTVVTLLVTPEQSERLALAGLEAKIQLALRNPLDTGSPATPGIKPAALLGATSRPVVRPATTARKPIIGPPPVAPPAAPTVEIIRGDKRERTTVS